MHFKNPLNHWQIGSLLFFGLVSCDKTPTDFNDCLLRYIKIGMNDSAVSALVMSCRNKFPEKKIPERELSAMELLAITGRGAPTQENYFLANIYNGNSKVTLIRLTITLTTKVSGTFLDRDYDTQVSIPPKSASDVGFKMLGGDSGAETKWRISSARGVDE